MAIYNATSSGNLIFAITGLGNPVPTFVSEGIATSAIAASPIAGDNPKIWTLGPPNFVASSGGLSFVEYNLGTQSGLAASAIGEFPISGIVDNIPQIDVVLAFVTAAATSSGNLVITGNTVANRAWFRLSNGNLVISANSVSDIDLTALSAGNLTITGSTVSSTLFNELSAGNVLISTSDSYVIDLAPPSAGNLVIAGETVEIQAWNKQSAGNLVTTGNTVNVITLQPTSSGNLIVTDFGYSSPFTGGIAADPLASQAIASGDLANVTTAQISFYGDIESHGNLVIDPVGELVNSLSDSSGIAGAAQASVPIGGTWTTYTAVVQVSYISNGQFFPGNVAYTTTAGTVLMSGNTVVQSILNVDIDSSGNLVINGTTVASTTQNSASAGLLTITGTTEEFADYAQTSAGNLAILAASAHSVTFHVLSSGNIVITGTSSDEFIPAGTVTSSGNLVITGTTAHNSTVSTVSLGLEIITGTSQSVFVPAVKPTPVGGGGGSYVFPSSWDILKPYFPDDRHILGYQQAQTDPGNLRVTGFTQVTVISNPGARRKTLSDYIKSLGQEARPAPVKSGPISDTVPLAVQDFAQLALAEDQLLLSDRLGDFDPIQAELDQELNQ